MAAAPRLESSCRRRRTYMCERNSFPLELYCRSLIAVVLGATQDDGKTAAELHPPRDWPSSSPEVETSGLFLPLYAPHRRRSQRHIPQCPSLRRRPSRSTRELRVLQPKATCRPQSPRARSPLRTMVRRMTRRMKVMWKTVMMMKSLSPGHRSWRRRHNTKISRPVACRRRSSCAEDARYSRLTIPSLHWMDQGEQLQLHKWLDALVTGGHVLVVCASRWACGKLWPDA